MRQIQGFPCGPAALRCCNAAHASWVWWARGAPPASFSSAWRAAGVAMQCGAVRARWLRRVAGGRRIVCDIS